MSDDFSNNDITAKIPVETQEELQAVSREEDTQPDSQQGRFWIRFGKMEKEIALLHEAFLLIYKALHGRDSSYVPAEYLQIIYRIAKGIMDQIPMLEEDYEITEL